MLTFFEATSQTYTIEAKFKLDTVYNFTVKRAKISSQNPATKDLSQLTQITTKFTRLDENELRFLWKYGETKAMMETTDITSQIGSDYVELINLYKNFELELSLDKQTGEIKLLNYGKMKDNLANSFTKMYANKATADIDSTQSIQIMKQLEATYSTPSLLLATYFPEIDLYFSLYLNTLEKNAVYDYEGLYPNPFGGEAFPVKGKVVIESVEKDTLKVKDTSKIEDEDVNRILKDIFERMTEEQNRSLDKEEIPTFTFDSVSHFHYNLNEKVVIKALSKKINKTSDVTQTQILEVSLLD